MASDIGVIAPDKDLMEMFQQIREESFSDFELHTGLFNDAVNVARSMVARGVKVLVSRGETTLLIRSAISVPVVDIPITVHDVIPLIDQARAFSDRIAIIGFGEIVKAARVAAPILSVELTFFQLHSTQEIPEVVDQVCRQGFTTVVGNPYSVTLAEERGLKGFPLRTQRPVLLTTLDEASRLAEISRRENEWESRQQVFIDSTREGVLVLDDMGRLLQSNQLVNLDPGVEAELFEIEDDVRRLKTGEMLDAVLCGEPWNGVIHAREGGDYLCRIHPVARGGMNFGAVILLEPARRQDLQQQRSLSERGLVAQHHFEDIVHDGKGMRDLIAKARRYAAADSTILIMGECGTGKELIAQSLHNASRRSKGPFVAVNCSALPENLMESELFGYEEGAFTGATKGGKKGLFEMANTGTIFLDEIGEMPLTMQVKLLRVLEERQVMRLGSERLVPLDVRVICATNRNLARMATMGGFRQDLYFRINVLRLTLPALRERGTCIDELIRFFSREIGYRLGGSPPDLGEDAMDTLRHYSYPGNVREMKSILERIMVECWGREVCRRDILENLEPGHEACGGEGIKETAPSDNAPSSASGSSGATSIRQEELRLIHQTLEECGGNRAETARRLGISTTTLWRRLRDQPQ
ncbi:AAA domain-containing protein [Pseudodesulfovibrio cashew]|uniref:AAA domain-containing protein n=1 Tax=Pseudodesulfovibrio cashew TaxID=2678688 RepID=A0A6I6JP55_9BACT|nr:sigma-54-dependent Fis family transcriptional regulator [Pseudodesulfovibrio cashew]QGY41833.1 AAA domain-containing protein [Pseudodesulfovibrio cashew]